MFNAILNGLLVGAGVNLCLIFGVMFATLRFNFKDYPMVLIYVITHKESPLWTMIIFILSFCTIISVMGWGYSEGGVERRAVLWGLTMYFGTYWAYRLLWGFIEAGIKVYDYPAVWAPIKVKGSRARKGDQRIGFIILVLSVLLTTALAVKGVYN